MPNCWSRPHRIECCLKAVRDEIYYQVPCDDRDRAKDTLINILHQFENMLYEEFVPIYDKYYIVGDRPSIVARKIAKHAIQLGRTHCRRYVSLQLINVDAVYAKLDN